LAGLIREFPELESDVTSYREANVTDIEILSYAPFCEKVRALNASKARREQIAQVLKNADYTQSTSRRV
jgi:hypothetical protein